MEVLTGKSRRDLYQALRAINSVPLYSSDRSSEFLY